MMSNITLDQLGLPIPKEMFFSAKTSIKYAIFLISILILAPVNEAFGALNSQGAPKYEATIEISDALRLGIYFDGKWKVVETRDNLLQNASSKTLKVRFPSELENEFISCFEKNLCPSILRSDLLSKVEVTNEFGDEIYGLKLGLDYIAVLRKNYFEHNFALIDLKTGRVLNLGKYDRKYAFSESLGGIFYADCENGKTSCIVQFRAFQDDKQFVPFVVDFKIEDMRVSKGQLQMLAKREINGTQSLLDRLLSAMGHPNSYYRWSLIEVSLDDSTQVESPLHNKSANSWGRFICKWCYPQE